MLNPFNLDKSLQRMNAFKCPSPSILQEVFTYAMQFYHSANAALSQDDSIRLL